MVSVYVLDDGGYGRQDVDKGITWVKWVAVVRVRVSRSVTHGCCAVHLRHLRVQLVYLKQQESRVLFYLAAGLTTPSFSEDGHLKFVEGQFIKNKSKTQTHNSLLKCL